MSRSRSSFTSPTSSNGSALSWSSAAWAPAALFPFPAGEGRARAGPLARGGALGAPGGRGVGGGERGNPNPADLLLRLGERAVGHDRVAAVGGVHDGRRAGVVQTAA